MSRAEENWVTNGREIELEDMSTSHIQSAVLLLYRRAREAREYADATDNAGLEKKADQQLEFAYKWFKKFGAEVKRRKEEGIMNNDPRVTEEDILDLLPEDLEEHVP